LKSGVDTLAIAESDAIRIKSYEDLAGKHPSPPLKNGTNRFCFAENTSKKY